MFDHKEYFFSEDKLFCAIPASSRRNLLKHNSSINLLENLPRFIAAEGYREPELVKRQNKTDHHHTNHYSTAVPYPNLLHLNSSRLQRPAFNRNFRRYHFSWPTLLRLGLPIGFLL